MIENNLFDHDSRWLHLPALPVPSVAEPATRSSAATGAASSVTCLSRPAAATSVDHNVFADTGPASTVPTEGRADGWGDLRPQRLQRRLLPHGAHSVRNCDPRSRGATPPASASQRPFRWAVVASPVKARATMSRVRLLLIPVALVLIGGGIKVANEGLIHRHGSPPQVADSMRRKLQAGVIVSDRRSPALAVATLICLGEGSLRRDRRDASASGRRSRSLAPGARKGRWHRPHRPGRAGLRRT